ncbi:MAG: hypothetical protein II359_01525 [Clostridia bacterium]|nr:hypothetical protein [Clostridia bacterium]
MKNFVRLFMLIFCVALVLFFAGVAYIYVHESRAWKTEGFYACTVPSNVRVDEISVADGQVHLSGAVYSASVSARMDTYSMAGNLSYNTADTALPGYMGYTHEIRDGVLYIGIVASEFFGKIGTGNSFDITIDADGIHAVALATSSNKDNVNLRSFNIWSTTASIPLTNEEIFGIQISKENEEGFDFVFTIPQDQASFFLSDMTYTHIIEQWDENSYYSANIMKKTDDMRWILIHKETGNIRIGSDIGIYEVNANKKSRWLSLINGFTTTINAADYTAVNKLIKTVSPMGTYRPGNICLNIPDAITGRDYTSIGTSKNNSAIGLVDLNEIVNYKTEEEIPLLLYRRTMYDKTEFIFADGTYLAWSDMLDRILFYCNAEISTEQPVALQP